VLSLDFDFSLGSRAMLISLDMGTTCTARVVLVLIFCTCVFIYIYFSRSKYIVSTGIDHGSPFTSVMYGDSEARASFFISDDSKG
jgi:hypothetical protein